MLIALGMVLRGSLVSPAVMPTSSMPEYAKTTPCETTSAGSRPLGRKPPFSLIRENPVGAPVGVPKSTKQMPTIRNTTSAETFTTANQNSISPKSFTEIRLVAMTTTSTTAAISHCGRSAMNWLYCPNHLT